MSKDNQKLAVQVKKLQKENQSQKVELSGFKSIKG